MSNESVPDCLTHKDSRNIQVRLDYMLLYRSETKAKVIRIMETWTNQKRAEWQKHYVESKEQGFDVPEEAPEEALWVTMSYEEFSIYAYGTMNHDNIKQNVDELVEHQHLKRRPHPQIPYGPPQYLLDTWLLQELLNEQELPSLFDDIGKIKPPRKKRTPQVKYPQGRGINTPRDGGKIPPGTGENTPPSKNTTKNYRESTKNEDEGANAPAALINFAERKTESDKHKAVTSDTAYHIATGGYEKDEAPTEPRTPAVKPPEQTPAASVSLSLAIAPNGGQDDTGGRQAILTSLTPITPAASIGMSVTGTPPASPEARQAGLKIIRKAVTQEKLSMKEDEPVIKPPTAAQLLKQQERRRDEILVIYAEELGRKPSRSKENLAGALLCAQDDVPDEDIRTTIKAILADDFLAKNISMAFVYKKLDALARKAMPKPSKNGKAPQVPDAYGNDYSLTALLARQQKAM